MGTLLDHFDEHDGPVRGIDFHQSQPLFVSGGDDAKVRVWNYRRRKSEFVLAGHVDYVRTVFFHSSLPWIVSASDDQTIRIWNWQSRSCITVLTGHNHYVMCAQFHPDPKEPLLVSASLDQTVRVWDLTGLRKRTQGPGEGGFTGGPPTSGGSTDLFGTGDAVVKFVLEGHDAGVNWATFHPTLPLIASGADDRTVRIWRMDGDLKAWEQENLRGHSNNVSCVAFHVASNTVISNSEDRTIRVWDMGRRQLVGQPLRREHDRFWVLAIHPTAARLTAGHDNGFAIFKLQQERPPMCVADGAIYYIKDRDIRSIDTASLRDTRICGARTGLKQLYYSPSEGVMLVWSDAESGSYEIVSVPKPGAREQEPKRGLASSVCFLGRNRFCCLESRGQNLVLKNFSNEATKRIPLAPITSADRIWEAPGGLVLIRCDDSIVLYDPSRKKSVGSADVVGVRQAVWSADGTRVAVMSKNIVHILNNHLNVEATVQETVHIKSGAWDGQAFVYTTLSHIKYLLPSGDAGAVGTLNDPIYIASVGSRNLIGIGRDFKPVKRSIESTEYLFKIALSQGRFDEVLKTIRESRLEGEAVVSYLQQKGFPEVALHLVQDDHMRFELALECGNIDIALESAGRLDNREYWNRLGAAALAQGNHQVVEMALQRTKAYERLSFLYAITGNNDKLTKMMRISKMRNDAHSQYHTALLVGDVDARIEVLEAAGLKKFAALCAKTHGLHAKAAELDPEGTTPEPPANAQLLLPPVPILRETNWPLLNISRGAIARALETRNEGAAAFVAEETAEAGAGWGMSDDEQPAATPRSSEDGTGEPTADVDDGGEAGGWDVGEVDLPDVPIAMGDAITSAPPVGPSVTAKWAQTGVAGDAVAAGDFATAMRLLREQAGVVQFEALRAGFLASFEAARASLPLLHGLPPVTSLLQKSEGVPASTVSLLVLAERLKTKAYKATTDGKFNDALAAFRSIVNDALLLVVDNRQAAAEVRELLEICQHYILGLRCQMAAKDQDPVRVAELFAYFSNCNLQSVHKALVLRNAMLKANAVFNYPVAAHFARQLLDITPAQPPTVQQQAKKILALYDATPNHPESKAMRFDPRNPFVLCGRTLLPLYRGTAVVRCPLCTQPFEASAKGSTCDTCQLAQIGADVSGMRWSR
eukprot:TRINITY_DN7596_c0_g1_i1.p1 TRINITY_DN7596_c0_g1~~TRINITY_DN7596_c0_g1_i1.p1  ORF type:complete len:1220 (-),score=283.92 TRINITY_DN7596_c0_g1_i1:1172-4642(-)